MIRLSQLLIGALLGLSAALGAQNATESQALETTLDHRSYRTWKHELPAAEWKRASGAIELGGRTYATGADGTKLNLDTNGDGEIDATLEGEDGRAILRDESGDAVYALRLRQGDEGWVYSVGSARRGKLGDTRITLFDQNLNGRFDDFGDDAIALGSNKTATFLSETIHVDGKLMTLEVAADGSSARAVPFDGKSGVLDLTSEFESKAKLLSAVMVSTDGRHSFDFAGTEGGLRVPAGSYQIHRAQLGLGKMLVDVTAGDAKPLVVREGRRTSWQWGGPVRAEFAYQRKGDTVVLDPRAVWYFGRSGEEYKGWNPVGKSPEFTIADSVTGQALTSAVFPCST